MFRVLRVDNETQMAMNDKGLLIRIKELLDPKRYELLYRGEGVKRISRPGSPATSTPQSGGREGAEGELYLSSTKVDLVTENKYFGKNKSTNAAMASQSRFYERFHVYAVEMDISGGERQRVTKKEFCNCVAKR